MPASLRYRLQHAIVVSVDCNVQLPSTIAGTGGVSRSVTDQMKCRGIRGLLESESYFLHIELTYGVDGLTHEEMR